MSLAYEGYDDSTLAVEGLDVAVKPGAFAAVVGPSGCGKSTLMKLVSGLVLPTTGEVAVRGERVTGPVRSIGMAFQNPLLMPWRTTLGNVMLPLEITQSRRGAARDDRPRREQRARDLLRSVGLGDFENKLPYQLSGGMKQRANLCRAIIHDPEILLLDEPFGALDAFTREELWLAMQSVWLERRFTAVLVTHDLQEAAFLADQIFVMSGRPGRVLECFDVAFPRPRTPALLAEAPFAALVAKLRNIVATARQS